MTTDIIRSLSAEDVLMNVGRVLRDTECEIALLVKQDGENACHTIFRTDVYPKGENLPPIITIELLYRGEFSILYAQVYGGRILRSMPTAYTSHKGLKKYGDLVDHLRYLARHGHYLPHTIDRFGIDIDVSDGIIKRGMPMDAHACPVALAINRSLERAGFKDYQAAVGLYTIDVKSKLTHVVYYQCKTPPQIQEWALNFDCWSDGEPFVQYLVFERVKG